MDASLFGKEHRMGTESITLLSLRARAIARARQGWSTQAKPYGEVRCLTAMPKASALIAVCLQLVYLKAFISPHVRLSFSAGLVIANPFAFKFWDISDSFRVRA